MPYPTPETWSPIAATDEIWLRPGGYFAILTETGSAILLETGTVIERE